MYDFIGDKIKGLAKAIFFVEAIASVIGGLILISIELAIVGILVIILGPLVAWVSSWLLYGFGQLIDNSDIIVTLMKKEAANHSEQKNDIATDKVAESVRQFKAAKNANIPGKRCPHCGDLTKSKRCDFCGKENNLF